MTTEATVTLTGTPETPVTTPATPSGGAEVNAATDPVPLFVYFPVQTPSGPRLARESIDVPGGTVGGAVAAMIAGPRDPDYLASWDPGTTVLSASEDDGVISLDLSAEVRRANTDATGTDLLAQQLVYTATEAAGAPDASVRLLIEGQTAGALWGTVAWDEPISRADVTAVRAAVQIDAPVQRQYITSETTTISGEALNPGPIAWRIVDAVGDEVASGEVQPDEETDPPSFSVTVELRVGRYTVEISVPDPNDPSGAPVTDTRAFSVHLGA